MLCPELRGLGSLFNLTIQKTGSRLDYWQWGTSTVFTLMTDGFLYGKTLLGETTEDLLRWEAWLAEYRGITSILDELRAIYRVSGAENQVQVHISPGKRHEMDIPLLLRYLSEPN